MSYTKNNSIMRKTILTITLFTILLNIIQSQKVNTCLQIIRESTDENNLMSELESRMHELKSETNTCVETLLRTGNFKALEFFLNELNNRNIKFRETLSGAINNLQKKLEDLHNKFRFDEEDFQQVSPAFQWAQSMDHLYLEIKFAHRHDSPGCLEVKNESVELYKNMVVFKAYCVLGDVPIKFTLPLELWQEVNTEETTHSFGSVGRYQITLKKRVGGMYWDKLLKDGTERPTNMKVWFEMREKYIDQIQTYIDDDEEEEFRRETEEITKKAKERRKKKRSNKKQETKSQEIPQVNNSIEEL